MGLLERIAAALESMARDWRRIADIFDPPRKTAERLNFTVKGPFKEE